MASDINLVKIGTLVIKRSEIKRNHKLIAQFRKERKLIMDALHFKEFLKDTLHVDIYDISIKQMREDVNEIDERIRNLEAALTKELEKH
jgi:hypothetical protein